MSKSIEFTTSGSCNALGGFASGGIARNIPDDLADHLVNEAQCAKYWTSKAPAPAAPPWPPEAEPAKKPAKAKSKDAK